MALFNTSLKKWFFDNGTKVLTDTSMVALLDSTGQPIGSASIEDLTRKIVSSFTNPEDFVDLGLPSGLLWSTKNIGAASPEDWGWYFSWGNVDGHPEGSGYDFSDATYNATSAASIATNLNTSPSQDAARANKGMTWRMPSDTEFKELSDNCTSAWTTVNGHAGRLFTSNINGKTIFFPASGYYNGTSLYSRGANGDYWSSTWISFTNARSLFFNSSSVTPQNNGNRRFGFSVRGVM